MLQQEIFTKSLNAFLSPIKSILNDSSVSEIMINGPAEIYIEKNGMLELSEQSFENEDILKTVVVNLAQYVGRRLAPEDYSFDARLPDGSRVNVALPPCSKKGICITIRKFIQHSINLDKLVELGSITPLAKEYLEIIIALAKDLIVSGGTGSGKTSLLNAMSSLIPKNQRIIVIEDTSELQIQQPHALSFETRAPDRNGRGAVTIKDLFKASLRQRPDRIIIGEVRSGEALDMIHALTSGHGGSMSTIHANTPLDTLQRLETLALMSDVKLPLHALRSQIASAIDVIIQTSRIKDGSRKIVYISEVMPLTEDGKYQIKDIFRFQTSKHSGDKRQIELTWTNEKSDFGHDIDMKGIENMVQLTKPIFQ